jgi:hypothetical protein
MLAGLGAAVLAPMAAHADASGGGVKPATEYDPITKAYAAETGAEISKDFEEQSGFDYSKDDGESPAGTSFNKKMWWEKEFVAEEWMIGKYDMVVDGKPSGTVEVSKINKMCDERKYVCDPGRGIVITGTNYKTGTPFVMNTVVEKWDGTVTFDMQKINGEDKDWTTKWDGRGWTFEDGSKLRYRERNDDDYYTRGKTMRFSY